MMTQKKNGRSKISTTKGFRDRRVRLSIDISRKFFCLQDLLGFDKASKTLDWLFTKSLTAIKDLVEQTNHSSSSALTDESKAKFLETIKEDSDEDNGKRKKSLVLKHVAGKVKKMTQRNKAKSRAEARARARERTKDKMFVKSLDVCGQIVQQNGDKDISWEFIMI
ncbi:hypothetical protein M8C21_007830 [Ambrosia artemisiifolia]|uniref:Cycloidea-like protein n=1 Tax=Ambrosia artemisiifolia TaxID=4212 RepID=A0AAD5CNA3_AMBAR|nr:hypothetical protein M8C21_007830 [Ambrosia artemisiifolia]